MGALKHKWKRFILLNKHYWSPPNKYQQFPELRSLISINQSSDSSDPIAGFSLPNPISKIQTREQ